MLTTVGSAPFAIL
jgi:hypothetical protein